MANHFSDALESMDKLADKLADNMLNRLIDRIPQASPLDRTDLDNVTLGKPSHFVTLTSHASASPAFHSRHSPSSHLPFPVPLAGRLRPMPNVIARAVAPAGRKAIGRGAAGRGAIGRGATEQVRKVDDKKLAEATASQAGLTASQAAAKALRGEFSSSGQAEECDIYSPTSRQCADEDVELMSMQRLDFHPVVTQLLTNARLPRARELIALSVEHLTRNLAEVQETYALVSEMMTVDKESSWAVKAEIDVRAPLARLSDTSALEPEELHQIDQSLKLLQELLNFFEAAEDVPRLKQLIERIQIDPLLVEAFDGAFEEDGQLSGVKFPELRRWRQEIARLEGQEKTTLDALLRDPKFQAMLSKDSPGDGGASVMNGRTVVAVPPVNRRKVGTLHGLSQTGKTCFVEPKQLKGLADEKYEATQELKAAETKALTMLTFAVGRAEDSILKNVQIAAEFDVVRAKAHLGKLWKGVIPEVKDEGRLEVEALKNAALALQSEDSESVGNSMKLDMQNDNARQGLLISGPNGGGKTVVMKAIALAALLVRLGVPIPAKKGARVDLFGPVLAVVGDAQSVEEKVSTFQAHCLALKRMLRLAQRGALLVCDEVGTGTDPSQGAVLAQAVMEECLDRGAVVMATTHYNRVKDFASGDDRLALGAMLLNPEGGPTFRLLVPGVGESHGIETAKRVFDGEFDQVVERAKSLMDVKQLELSELLLEAEERATALEVEQEALKKEIESAREARKLAEEKLTNAQKRLNEAKVVGMQEWRERLTEEEVKLEAALQKAKTEEKRGQMKGVSSVTLENSANEVSDLRKTLDEELRTLATKKEATPLGAKRVPPGTEVVYLTGPYKHQRVKVLTDTGKKRITVSLGAFPMEIARTDVGIPPSLGPAEKRKGGSSKKQNDWKKKVAFQLPPGR